MKLRIQQLWNGETPLHEAFWHYAVAYGLLLNLATSLLSLALVVKEAGFELLIPAFILPIPFNILVIVAVWRSAGRYTGPQKWADMARFGTVLWMVMLTAS